MIVAANAAANEVMNNHFKHPKDVHDRQAELDACNGAVNPGGCASEVRAKYGAMYDRNEAEVTNCASAAECTKQVGSLRQSQREYQARIGELLDKGVGSLSANEHTELANLQAGLSGLQGLATYAATRATNYGATLGDPSVANAATDIMIGAAAGVGSTGMLGKKGVQVSSKTLWKGEGQERIDVENPNPGQRPGQIHYQDSAGNKYLYDPTTNSFPEAPNSVNRLLDNQSFSSAINKGMTKYLGE